MAKNNLSDEKYKNALSQVRDSLQHNETIDVLIERLSQRSDFHSMVLKSLVKHSFFWLVLLITCFVVSLIVVKFPELSEWLLSLFKK